MLGYLVLGLLAHWPVFPGDPSRLYYGCDCTDTAQTVWFLAWTPHAVLTGHNPLFTHAVNYPVGVNLAQNTLMPLLGLLAAPITATLGPVASANCWMVLAMPLSATSAYLVLRHWRLRLPAAALGGLLYGFSPYLVGQGVNHLDLTFVVLPPLIIMIVVDLARSPRRPVRLGAVLALLVTGQFLVSPEILVTVVMLCVVGILAAAVFLVLRDPAGFLRRGRPMAVGLAVAAVVAGALLAYPAWFELAGPHHFVGPVQGFHNPFRADLLDFVVPSPFQWLAPAGLRAWGVRLTRLVGIEDGAYLGVPVLLLAGWLGWRSRAAPRTKLAALVAVIAGALSLGPHLFVNGHATSVPLPFLLLSHLPGLEDVLPIRISFETDAVVAAVIAFGVDDRLRGVWGRRPRLGHFRAWTGWGLAAAVLAVVAVTLAPEWPYASAPATAPAYLTSMPVTTGQTHPTVALLYPMPLFPIDQALSWQALAGFRFDVIGGYALVPGTNGAPTPFPAPLAPFSVEAFLGGTEYGGPYLSTPVPALDTTLVDDTSVFLRRYHVGLVAVDRRAPRSAPVVRLFTLAVGRDPRREGRLDVWRIGASRR